MENKFCWKKGEEGKDLWEVYTPEKLEQKNEKVLETAALIYQMCTNNKFRQENYKMFFTMFNSFYSKSFLFFESLFEFYESPLKISDKKLAQDIQMGLVNLLSMGLELEHGEFREILLKNKILQKKAFLFIEKLKLEHSTFLNQKLKYFLSIAENKNKKWFLYDHPLKLKKLDFMKTFNIEQVLIGNFDLTSLDPQFLAVNFYYLQKYLISEIQYCEFVGKKKNFIILFYF